VSDQRLWQESSKFFTHFSVQDRLCSPAQLTVLAGAAESRVSESGIRELTGGGGW
jgi:hypothetical protein